MKTVVLATDARVGALVAAASGHVTALVVASGEVAEAVAASGVDRVMWLGDPAGPAVEGWAGVVADAVAALAPGLVLAAGTPAGRVLAGAAAARLRAPVFAGVTRVASTGAGVSLTWSAFGGIVDETLEVTGPAVVVLDAAAAGGSPSASVPVEAVPVEDGRVAPGVRVEVVEERAAPAASDLGGAARIVAVGRGVRAREDLALVEALAAALGAEVGCSRVLGDWLGHDRVVGLSGRRVRPELYVAVGISGQLQHVVGARESGTVVVINSDPGCPYLAEADYAIVGDLYAVVPALTRALA